MKYVGIDLGTTNSVISSYDGETVHLYKNPDQQDVTPSAIYIDKRGKKLVGLRAYNNAARDPDNAATLFKRLMGTSTPIKLADANLTLTPEECSAEVLRVLYSYLPEEIRNSDETGTVITVPAAFNQMQKDATMAAAEKAGLGKVALMQEPVAAVMSVMRQRKADGIFVVYDLGGGTLDIAVAESIAGRVNLLAHGGIEMCGGRDFDRILLDNLVKPWLRENFDLPEDLSSNPKYRSLIRMATWAMEKAKIELSQKENVRIALSETELSIRDKADKEVYIEIPITRSMVDDLIAPKVAETIQAVRDTLEKAGLSSHDIERIVFVGGPTQYKPLRDKVTFELGIASSTDVNPMTAVSEGAALFAEAIDWSSQSRSRKNSRGAISADGQLNLSFNFIARTPDSKAKIVAKLSGEAIQGAKFQIDSLDTGWSSGQTPLTDNAFVEVSLSKPGDNIFKIFVFDAAGGPLKLENSRIVITRTAATIDAIPASSSIGIEVLDKIGGRTVLEYIVKENDPLPKSGKIPFKAAESLRAQSSGSLNFKLREGDIADPVTDNRFIGLFSITGSDFDDGVIAAGSDLICEYEVLDSGNIVLKVSVPSISGSFGTRNMYSPQAGKIDYTSAVKLVAEETDSLRKRLDDVSKKVDDENLDKAHQKLDEAARIAETETDPEAAKQAMDNIVHAKRLLSQVRNDNLKEIRQIDLDKIVKAFDEMARELARPAEAAAFDTLARTAQEAIKKNSQDFENLLAQLWGKTGDILRRQEWFIIDRFKWMAESPHLFTDPNHHTELVMLGKEAIQADDIEKLRNVVALMDALRIDSGSDSDMLATTNIVRG